MKIFIKNMVCNRCITAVEQVFKDLKIDVSSLSLGEVETKMDLEPDILDRLDVNLRKLGFEILENSSRQTIEHIKKVLILKINDLDIPENFILSAYVSDKIAKDYSSLSKIFSQNERVTLEHYFILQKIEKAKELLFYNEFSLTEISQKLGYRSVQHLSSQFKNITGFTPTTFKALKSNRRIAIDRI